MPDNAIQFETLQSDGTAINVRVLPYNVIDKCPFYIFAPEHYRADGTCR